MTNRQKLIDFLKMHPDGIDDDEIAKSLNFKARQQANMICRKLEGEKLVSRRLVSGKIHNFWVGGEFIEQQTHTAFIISKEEAENWFWEGNVQNQVVNYLINQDYKILSAANTVSREQGKDIVAEKNGKTLWVTVKGFPTGTARTRPSTQAGHWFKQAVFDILHNRGESKENELGLAIPDFPRYRSLAQKISWVKPIITTTFCITTTFRGQKQEQKRAFFQVFHASKRRSNVICRCRAIAKFVYFWVREDGEIIVE